MDNKDEQILQLRLEINNLKSQLDIAKTCEEYYKKRADKYIYTIQIPIIGYIIYCICDFKFKNKSQSK